MSVWKLNITLIVEERKCFPAPSEGHVQNVVKVMSNGRLPGAQEGSGRAGSSTKGAASHSWFSNVGTVGSRFHPIGAQAKPRPKPWVSKNSLRFPQPQAGHFRRWGRIDDNLVIAATMTLDNNCIVATSRESNAYGVDESTS